MKDIVTRNISRINYLWLIINLRIVFIVTILIRTFSFLIKNKPRHDLILFPYTQKGSDGYTRRFEKYFPLMEKEGIDYFCCDLFNDEYILKNTDSLNRSYSLYRKIAWKRLSQVLKSRHYKAVFIHRNLFPYYPDLKFPYFEKLMFSFHKNITVDFWDSVWEKNTDMVNKLPLYCHKVSCVNDYISEYFDYAPTKKHLFPIGVDLTPYIVKKNYSIINSLTFIYTGLPSNVMLFLSLASPMLKELTKHLDFKLILITRYRCEISDFQIEFHDFSEQTFYTYLSQADIGLYMVDDSVASRGKMAMKVMDYMSSALPCIASPFGLSPYSVDKENILIANSQKEWIDTILLLSKNEELRKSLGENGRKMVEEYHDIKNSFNIFKEIVKSS